MKRGLGAVQTRYGKVAGIEEYGITVFKAIPYAAPPVGELRWKAPAEPACWDGIRVCDHFGSIPWQLPGMIGKKALDTYEQNEDCLYLNIWTPSQTGNERFPVLFWIHGGGFQGGLGHEDPYNGRYLATKGVIVVSINYRLGVFGFLSHPELSKENPNHVSGNYGILDQIQALKWVKQNIAAFGGDPNRITIDGQSAGGMSVCCLLTSPMTHGLISGAIIQSGGPAKGRGITLAQSEKIGVMYQDAAGCGNIEEMRSLSPECLIHTKLSGSAGFMAFQPNIDNCVLPTAPYEAFVSGKISKVPIMFGSNSDEGLFSPLMAKNYPDFLKAAKDYLKDEFEEFLCLYPVNEETYEEVQLIIGRDFGFSNLRYVAQVLEKNHPCPVYHYYFCQPLILEDGTNKGAQHSGENFYVFNTLYEIGVSTLDGKPFQVRREHKDYVLSDMMAGYWSSFCKNGDPGTIGLPEWPAYDSRTDLHIHLLAGNVVAERSRFVERIEFMTEQIRKHERYEGRPF